MRNMAGPDAAELLNNAPARAPACYPPRNMTSEPDDGKHADNTDGPQGVRRAQSGPEGHDPALFPGRRH